MAAVEALFCPLCGGAVELEEGAQRGQCRSCQATLVLPSPCGFYHFRLEPRIGRNAALATAAMATDLPVENISALLLYVPFWSIGAETFGFVAGQRPIKPVKIETPSDVRTDLGEIPAASPRRENVGGEVIKKSLWLEQRFTALGVKWRDIAGLDAVKNSSAGLLPAEDEELSDRGIRIEPRDLPGDLASQEAEAYFRGHLLFPYGEYPILHAAIANLRLDRKLIYYPVWRLLGFTKVGRLACTVDAVNGDRIMARQYSRPRPHHPTKYLLAALALSLLLSLAYAPADGRGLGIAAGVLSLGGAIAAGIWAKRYLVDRLADRFCRLIWRV